MRTAVEGKVDALVHLRYSEVLLEASGKPLVGIAPAVFDFGATQNTMLYIVEAQFFTCHFYQCFGKKFTALLVQIGRFE